MSWILKCSKRRNRKSRRSALYRLMGWATSPPISSSRAESARNLGRTVAIRQARIESWFSNGQASAPRRSRAESTEPEPRMNVVRTLMDAARPAVRAKRAVFGPTRPTGTEELEIIAHVLRLGAKVTTKLPIDVQRRVMEPVARPPFHGSRFEATRVAGVPASWCIPAEERADSVVLYLHGGGYATGSIR